MKKIRGQKSIKTFLLKASANDLNNILLHIKSFSALKKLMYVDHFKMPQGHIKVAHMWNVS